MPTQWFVLLVPNPSIQVQAPQPMTEVLSSHGLATQEKVSQMIVDSFVAASKARTGDGPPSYHSTTLQTEGRKITDLLVDTQSNDTQLPRRSIVPKRRPFFLRRLSLQECTLHAFQSRPHTIVPIPKRNHRLETRRKKQRIHLKPIHRYHSIPSHAYR